ncbi:MAG: hypothetical protein IJ134_03935 [Bacilli bacterium]|nr:hypothetical protein [Bacilli bacterium]
MNVIVANKYQTMLQGLDIDIIKTMYGEYDADEIVSTFQNFYFQRMILDITAIKNYKDITNLQKLSISLDMDKVILLLDDSPESTSPAYLSQLISMGIYNFTKDIEGIMYLYNNPNSYRDVAHIHQLNSIQPTYNDDSNTAVESFDETKSQRIIGITNLSKQSGATTLTYMMKNQLKQKYSVVALEVDKREFMYFNDKELLSTVSTAVSGIVAKNSDKEVILIDTNGSKEAEKLCTDIIYLLEPSTIKLNRLLYTDRNFMTKNKNNKVVLNQSLLNSNDVSDFEYESNLKIFCNVPPLNERDKDITPLNKLLTKLGFTRFADDEQKKKKGFF